MSQTRSTTNELKREITRLRAQVSYWQANYTEAIAALDAKLPALTLDYHNGKVRVFLFQGVPFVFAGDVLAQLPNAPRRASTQKGPQTTQRLRGLGLGSRELNGLNAVDVAKAWGTTERYICSVLGLSRKAHWFGAVTPLGIETLRDRAPEFCSWVEREAFPAVIKRFGKRGAS